MTTLPRTITHLFHRQAERLSDRVATYHRSQGSYLPTTWQESADWVGTLARGLWELGCRRGDRVAILAETRREWLLADFASLTIGCATVGIYPTSTGEQVAYILRHSESKVAIVEDAAQAAKIAAHRETLPALEQVIVLEAAAPTDDALPLDTVRARGRAALAQDGQWLRARRNEVQPQDIATLIYTSGTTGPPKGVVLTHENLHSIALITRDWMNIDERDTAIVFLPLAHSLQRVAAYAGVAAGLAAYYADATTLVETFAHAQPTLAASVPRVFEKIHAKIIGGLAQAPAHRRKIFEAAMHVGRLRSRYLQQNRRIPLHVAASYALFDRLVFSKLRARTFGQNIRFLISGGAPIARELLEFFHAANILIVEGYGLTETSAPATLNRPGEFKFGSVGRPLPGTQLRFGDDGEILIHGPGVFREYYRDPQATAAVLDEEGWFRSGDIGLQDSDGFLRITDRKKDLIVTAGGKNIAPQNVENLLKQAPLISQVLLHGDRRNFLVALITLDSEELAAWARTQGLEQSSAEELSTNAALRSHVAALVETTNGGLARYETIKKFALLPLDFTVENGLLTPTLKVKRRAVEQRFAQVLDDLYGS